MSTKIIIHRIVNVLIAILVAAFLAFTAKTVFYKAENQVKSVERLVANSADLKKEIADMQDEQANSQETKRVLRSVLDFQISHPKYVMFVSGADGVIRVVDGSVTKWGYTATQLIGTKVQNLRPEADRIKCLINCGEAAKSPVVVEVCKFDKSVLLGADLNEYSVDGGMVWFPHSGELLTLFAPTLQE